MTKEEPMKLIVTEPFNDYAKGAEITDSEKVAEILQSPHVAHVVKVADPAPDAAQTEQH